jgi:hypothetical protein
MLSRETELFEIEVVACPAVLRGVGHSEAPQALVQQVSFLDPQPLKVVYRGSKELLNLSLFL